jgi:hypothetical protein
MKEINEYEKDLASIRTMMERSVKFLSLSGVSGVLAGAIALIGSAAAYTIIYYPSHPLGNEYYADNEQTLITPLLLIASVVLILSIGTGCLFSWRKAKKTGTPIWNTTSKQLLTDLLIPLGTGGILILIFIGRGYFSLVVPTSLVFYGLALIQGGRSTYDEIRYLGLTEIVLGLACALFPGFGLVFWATGFGLMHMVYGTVMYFRYDR